MPSGGLNTVRTPRMSCIMLSNFHWSAITLIDIWSPVAYFSGLILWLWVIGWRGILAHLSKYFLKMVQISFFFMECNWQSRGRCFFFFFLAMLSSNQADTHRQSYFCTHVFDDDVVLITVCHFWFLLVCFRGHCQHSKWRVEWGR